MYTSDLASASSAYGLATPARPPRLGLLARVAEAWSRLDQPGQVTLDEHLAQDVGFKSYTLR